LTPASTAAPAGYRPSAGDHDCVTPLEVLPHLDDCYFDGAVSRQFVLRHQVEKEDSSPFKSRMSSPHSRFDPVALGRCSGQLRLDSIHIVYSEAGRLAGLGQPAVVSGIAIREV